MPFRFVRTGLAVLLAAVLGHAGAQDFPNRTLTMVMPYAAGGPGDTITRVFAGAMQKHLGQQIVVDNTAGASGAIGTAKVARAKPDGYTLLMIHVSHATNTAMYKNLPYDPVRDFAPVTQLSASPYVLVTNLARTLRELQEREIWVIGTAGEAESDLYAADWPVATDPVNTIWSMSRCAARAAPASWP